MSFPLRWWAETSFLESVRLDLLISYLRGFVSLHSVCISLREHHARTQLREHPDNLTQDMPLIPTSWILRWTSQVWYPSDLYEGSNPVPRLEIDAGHICRLLQELFNLYLVILESESCKRFFAIYF